MDEKDIKRKNSETAKLFAGGAKLDPPYSLWREFNHELANDFSRFITGNLYSRNVLTIQERQMAACAMLAAIKAKDELEIACECSIKCRL